MKNNKNYLPSKKFLYLLTSFLVIAIMFFLAFKLFSNKNSFFASKNNAKLQAENLTVLELTKKDSDLDGVTDWEEILWGTDPKHKETFGILDATYIKNERAKSTIDNNIKKDGSSETETDKFAKQFFASYSAMKASGDVNNNTINDFSSALGQKITDPSIVNKYSKNEIKVKKSDEDGDQEDYYITTANLFEKYKKDGVGDELEVAGDMASMSQIQDIQNQDKLNKISLAYQSFAKELILVSVPESLKEFHLKIINNSNNISVAISNMSKMINDPILGILGISQYEKYSEDLISSVNDLEDFLKINGIIPE